MKNLKYLFYFNILKVFHFILVMDCLLRLLDMSHSHIIIELVTRFHKAQQISPLLLLQ